MSGWVGGCGGTHCHTCATRRAPRVAGGIWSGREEPRAELRARAAMSSVEAAAEAAAAAQMATARDDPEIVGLANCMLAAAGLSSTVQTAADVRAVCASTNIFLAAAEAILGVRLPVATRAPATPAERVETLRMVVRHLSEHVLQADLSHISPERIVQGAQRDVRDLVEILAALARYRASPLPGDHSSRRAAERSAAGGVSSSSVALLPDGSTDVEAIEKIARAAKKEVRRKTRKAKKAARKAPNSAAATTQKEASRIYLPTSLLPAKPRRKATQKKAAAVPPLDAPKRTSLRPLRAMSPSVQARSEKKFVREAKLLKEPYANEMCLRRRPQSARKQRPSSARPARAPPPMSAAQRTPTPRAAMRARTAAVVEGGFSDLSTPLADRLGRVLSMARPTTASSAGRREPTAEQRAAAKMDMWARSRQAQRRADEAIERRREKAAAMLRRHEAKRARIAASEFAKSVESQRASAKLRREAEEEVLFRELFLAAVEREKARVLDERRTQRLIEEESFRRSMSADASREEALRAQCDAMNAAAKEERRQRLALSKAAHDRERIEQREARERAAAQRKELMSELAVAEEALYLRGHDVGLVGEPIVELMANRIREEALRVQAEAASQG